MRQKTISYQYQFFLAFTLVVVGDTAVGQSIPFGIEWQVSLGGASNEALSVVLQTSDGGYIVGGSSWSTNSGNKTCDSFGSADYWLVKLDAHGTKQWETNYGGAGDEFLWSLHQTDDGGYIVGGYSSSDESGNKTSTNLGGYDTWILKLDANGSKEWEMAYDGSSNDSPLILKPTSDRGCILGGSYQFDTSSNRTSVSYGRADYWVMKIDTHGIKQWETNFGGTDIDHLTSLEQTADNGFILGGFSNSGVSGNKTSSGSGYWLVKLDAGGNKQWETNYSFGYGTEYDRVLQTSDAGYILSRSSPLGSGYGVDYWVVKLDARATRQWETNYGGTGGDWLFCLQQTSDDGYILGGNSYSTNSGNKTTGNFGNSDYWVVKLDVHGARQWEMNLGGTGNDWCRSVHETCDGGYILGGYSWSTNSGNKTSGTLGNSDFWIVKLAHVPPSLLASRSGTNLLISWPADAQNGGVLESSTTLTNWSVFTNPLVTEEDGHNAVRVPATPIKQFFRLRR